MGIELKALPVAITDWQTWFAKHPDTTVLLPRTLELARRGFLTRAYKSTIGHLGDRLQASGAESTLVNVLCDAQTSGGLLICVPEERSGELVTALHDNGALCAATIGTVRQRGDFAMVLV